MKPGFNIAQDTAPKGKTWTKTIEGDYGFGKPNLNQLTQAPTGPPRHTVTVPGRFYVLDYWTSRW
jgi:hypothetical protein